MFTSPHLFIPELRRRRDRAVPPLPCTRENYYCTMSGMNGRCFDHQSWRFALLRCNAARRVDSPYYKHYSTTMPLRGGKATARVQVKRELRSQFYPTPYDSEYTADVSSHSTLPSIKSTHKVPKSASQAILSGMHLAFMGLAPNTSQRFALIGATNAFLVGENPTCSVPAL